MQEAASRTIKAVLGTVKNRYDAASLTLFSQRTLSSITEELRSAGIGHAALSAMAVLSHLIGTSSEVLNLENSSELFEIVFGMLGHKSPHVRLLTFEVIPAMSAQVPRYFAQHFLDRWVGLLLETLKREKDRTYLLIAVASSSNALGAEMSAHAWPIAAGLKALLQSSSKSKTEEHWLYRVISSLAEACKADFLPAAKVLVPSILQQELTDASVGAVVASLRGAPDLVLFVEDRILAVVPAELAAGSAQRANLAIKLVTSTPFHRPFLATAVGRTLVDLMDSPRVAAETRLLAANAVVSHSKRAHKPGVFCEAYAQVSRVLHRLQASCLLEPDPRHVCALVALLNSACFDVHWSSAASLQNFFSLLSTGSLKAKLEILAILQRLSPRLRALLRPNFRAFLAQLAWVLKHGDDGVEEAGVVLERLVLVDEGLTRPYAGGLVQILLARLAERQERICITSLATLTHLVAISPSDFVASIDGLVDLLTGMFQDLSSEALRLGSLRCLGCLLRNVDRDMLPTSKYVSLIPETILLLRVESVREVRDEALRLLGIIGAVDPYRMRSREIEILALDLKEGQGQAAEDALVADGALMQEDQYPIVATEALLRILKDPSMAAHHMTSFQALVYIFRSVKVKAAGFLPQTLPVLVGAIQGQPNGHLDFYFQSLAHIVASVSLHIRPFVPELVALVRQFWAPDAPTQLALLSLVESLVAALKGECRAEVGGLVQPCLRLLAGGRPPLLQKALRTLAVLVLYLGDHVPALVRALLALSDSAVPADVDVAMLRLLERLLPDLGFGEQAPSLLRIVARALEATDHRVRLAAMEVAALLLKHYEPAVRPHLPGLLRVADEHQVALSAFLLHGPEGGASGLASGLAVGMAPGLAGFHTQGRLTPSSPAQGFCSQGFHTQGASSMLDLDAAPADLAQAPARKLGIHEANLRKAWEGFLHCTSKEDWFDWLRRLGHEFIRESPSASIRACSIIASNYQPIVRELFNVAFLSCWNELAGEVQDELVGALEEAFASQTVPAEVIQAFLSLAEFMEHEEHPLPIDITTLGTYAIKCHAYAKALYYKEMEFQSNPSTAVVESLISLNSQLQLPDAASGALAHAQKTYDIVLKESWYEKLQHWESALEAYEKKWRENREEMEPLLGIFRCKHALGDWGGLNDLACGVWSDAIPAPPGVDIKTVIAPWAAAAAWGLGKWALMGGYVEKIPAETIDGSFFRSILAIKQEAYGRFTEQVLLTRERLDAELTTMINESYSRAYRTTVRVQMLAELEEVAEYRHVGAARQERIRDTWSKRLLDCQETVDVWQRILKIRALVIEPAQEQELWIHFAGLCRRMQRQLLSKRVLHALLGVEDHQVDQLDLAQASPPAVYALLEHYWDAGERGKALTFMQQYARLRAHSLQVTLQAHPGSAVEKDTQLLSRCYVKLGKWLKLMAAEGGEPVGGRMGAGGVGVGVGMGAGGGMAAPHDGLDTGAPAHDNMDAIMQSFVTATSYDKNSYKAWHGWALTNFDAAALHDASQSRAKNPYIVPAVQGFFRSISLSGGDSFQDSLRLLTMWFRYGAQPEVNAAVGDGFHTIPVENWLQVIPQLIARIHTPSPQVRRLVHQVLFDIGRLHPQALLYPLTVATKSQSISRRTSAEMMLDRMRSHSARLVEQAGMVSQELIRVAITWEEMWYEALEEASKFYFGDRNVAAMLALLDPLHLMIERGRETQREHAFYAAHGAGLKEARGLCQKHKKTGSEEDLKAAWDLYYQVFRKINKQLPQLVVLDLESASPKLLAACSLDIPIPGTYKAGAPPITIASVAPVMSVIASKQRPRKLVFVGSDGQKYKFLLKGHEDLRQDERVMQLFGLVNALLAAERETSKRHLAIQLFSVVPLSQNTGLIGWVPHCDTIHTLIRDYREGRGILLSSEHRLMLQFAPDYDHLTELQKVEVFDHAMTNTDGLDLNRVLWKKSQNAESWLERRTTYTRSLAVMSMVGYVLGLGDRHPSNLMIDQVTGRVVHIDFGDCFEVAMHREKFPEKVPFRLTRMLVKAMEVSQVEGTFRIVSECTMAVLRESSDSLMAVLEAFVYDPLINWRLLATARTAATRAASTGNYSDVLETTDGQFPENFSTTKRSRMGPVEISRLEEESVNRPEAVNAGALNVVNRVRSKLTGRDFCSEAGALGVQIDVPTQVELLIGEAVRVENLCQSYVGWCPFW